MPDQYDILEDAVRDMFASAVWSHKIQEKQADIYHKKYERMEKWNIACCSLTSIGILLGLFSDCPSMKLLSLIASLILSCLTIFFTIYLKSYNFSNLIKSHKTAANMLLIVRNEIKSLIASIKLRSKTSIEIEESYNKLMNKANKIYMESPQTTDEAVADAEIALDKKRDNTFTDEEIDSYLPYNLRKIK